MTQTVTCSSCKEQNDYDLTKVCTLCGAPLLMTHLASVAPVAQQAAASSAPVAGVGLNPIGGSSGLNSVSMLVPITASGGEDIQRAIKLPQGEFELTLGWTDFQSGHFPNIDFVKLFPDMVLVKENGREMVAVSRRTGKIKRDLNDHVFLARELYASSLMWVQKPNETPEQVLKGDEAYLQPGMYVYLGKNNQGITFVVR